MEPLLRMILEPGDLIANTAVVGSSSLIVRVVSG